jgi:hypothetical protein
MRTVIQVRDDDRHEAGEWYEADLYGGKIDFDSSSGKTLEVTIQRAPYWHGEETVCQVANTSTGWSFANTCDIYNHDDDEEGHNNWVLVDAPEGDVPTPAMIVVRNTYSEGRLGKVALGWSDRPAILTLEGEEADSAHVVSGTEYSNNAYGRSNRFHWDVAHTSLVDFVGMYRALAFGELSGTWELSVGYEVSRMQTLESVDGQHGWTDLGAVMLPPGGYTHPTRYDMSVWLEGSANRNLDFLMFVPMQQYRILEFQGYNALPGTCIEDNGIRDELVYRYGDERMPIVNGWGRRIHLWPDDMLPQALPGPTPPNEQMLVLALYGGGAEALRTARLHIRARPRYAMIP